MLTVSRRAEADIESAYRWYESRRPGLGIAFLAELDLVFGRIGETPDAYAPASGESRRALSRRFPYAIYFTHRARSIVVQAVLHQRRSPPAIPTTP